MAEGKIDAKRFENYIKLQKEQAYLADRQGYLEKKEKLFKHYATLLRKNKKNR